MNINLDLDQRSATQVRHILVDAANSVAAVNNIECLREFRSNSFRYWVSQQGVDLSSQCDVIRKTQELLVDNLDPDVAEAISISTDRIKEMTLRSARLKELQADAESLGSLSDTVSASLRDNRDDIQNLRAGQQDDNLIAKMTPFAKVINEQVIEISRLIEKLSPVLAGDRATALLRAATTGTRPIKDALDRDIERLAELETRIDTSRLAEKSNTDTASAAEVRPTSQRQQPGPAEVAAESSGVNPQIQLRRKELGGALSDGEVARRSEVYFRSLWALDINQSHCGAILIFEPSVSRGINIHDLLGLSNTDAMLEQAKTQIMARFGRRD
jgi:hypothetical protein